MKFNSIFNNLNSKKNENQVNHILLKTLFINEN